MKMNGTLVKRTIAMALAMTLVFGAIDIDLIPGRMAAAEIPVTTVEPAASPTDLTEPPEAAPTEGAVPAEEGTPAEETVPPEKDTPGEDIVPGEEAAPGEESASAEVSVPEEPAERSLGDPIYDPVVPVYADASSGDEAESGTDETGLFVLPAETEPAEEDEPAAGTEPRSLTIQAGHYVITATGDIPEGAELQAVEIPAEAARAMAGKDPLFAYDIRLVVDGKVWQPESEGKSVRISVRDEDGGLNADDVKILHVKTDVLQEDGSLSEEALEQTIADLSAGSVDAEQINTRVNNGAVSFETGSFSPVMGTALAKLQAMFEEALQSEIKAAQEAGTIGAAA